MRGQSLSDCVNVYGFSGCCIAIELKCVSGNSDINVLKLIVCTTDDDHDFDSSND
jgi:hypothetical protein